MSTLFYDDVLPLFVEILRERASRDFIERNLFLRDPSGRLTFVILENEAGSNLHSQVGEIITSRLSPYVDDAGFAIATPDELFDDSLVWADAWPMQVRLKDEVLSVRMVDRRVVGTDWLQTPSRSLGVPRIVFASLKGGVGRSTALCVAAAALSAAGHRVLAIDMDVEAPGLGSMLLEEGTAPELGLLDYLVEANFGRSSNELSSFLISPSWLGRGKGVIDVLPALGARVLANPQNVLSKIARAYVAADGDGVGVTGRLRRLVDELANSNNYDVILIDARAGLHETTGAAILGLGAKILLFGTDQPQTIAAYDLLFANLALARQANWEEMLSLVHSKASSDAGSQGKFSDAVQKLLTHHFHPEVEAIAYASEPADLGFNVDWETDERLLDEILDQLLAEEEQAFAVVSVLESESFRDFDPIAKPDSLTATVYDAVYGDFVKHVFSIADLLVSGSVDE